MLTASHVITVDQRGFLIELARRHEDERIEWYDLARPLAVQGERITALVYARLWLGDDPGRLAAYCRMFAMLDRVPDGWLGTADELAGLLHDALRASFLMNPGR